MQNTSLPTSVRIIFTNSLSISGMISPKIACTRTASFSCILTIAEYLCENFPELTPPNFPESIEKMDQGLTLEEKKAKKLYFEPWCDYLNTLIDHSHENGRIVEESGTMCLICKVDEDYYQKIFKLTQVLKFQPITNEEIENVIKNQTKQIPKQSRLRVGIINFAASQLKQNLYNPKVNLLSLFTGIWFKHGDSWRRYDVLKGHYPTEQEINNTDIFILSGSTYSVNDGNVEIGKTMELLREGMKRNGRLKLLGLCFGHQAIAKFMGGVTVERGELYSGMEVIRFDKSICQQFSYLHNLEKLNNQGYVMFEFHNDYVTGVSESQFRTLGNSPSSQHESLVSVDGRILSFQFHTEYTYPYVQDFEIKVKNFFKQDLYKTDYILRLQALEKYGLERHLESCAVVRAVVRKFIEWRAGSGVVGGVAIQGKGC